MSTQSFHEAFDPRKMKHTVWDRLLKREIGEQRRAYTDVRGIYGARHWVDNLDILNEASLSWTNYIWSTSGKLLASGSDDHRINIHAYHPDSSTSQFSLTTSILTGHRSNIFSVKFMPYSNDRTIVSATDDVKIFDIEHSGHSALRTGSNRSNTGSSRSMAMSRDNVTLTRGDTDAKDFRCHSDTVKRIVTEDNPFYFLTCSQDGDVRQWDVRAPSTLYPPQRDSMIPSWARDEAVGNVPPPLISYSRYGIELNTVSCSPSQPHLIALGGSHLHCFVHDRRMLGRDVNNERGARLPSPGNWCENDDELLAKATRCVKKFSPNGKQRMKRGESGHITACKISDAVPNELIVSWSGDHIYSFDMLRASDARDKVEQTKVQNGDLSHRVKDTNRKRKRPKSKSSALSQEGAERAGSRQRTQSTEEDLALRVTYDNGQSEDLRIQSPAQTTRMSQEDLNDLRATDHYRIAKAWLTISKRIFDLGEHGETGLKLAFTSILGLANSIISDMDNIGRTWGYPVDPDYAHVAVQNKLRDSRAATRRFVQAAGTLARVMGGQLLTGNTSDALIAQYFTSIQPAPRERELPQHEHFSYDFMKAILLWLDSGPGAVVERFSGRSSSDRLPIPHDSDMDGIQDHLIPYLLDLASDDPIVNVDESKYAIDENRVLFSTEKEAVLAFAHAVTIPFEDLTGTAGSTSSEPTQTRAAAKRRWAFLVGRGVLLNAAKSLSLRSIDCAYGGRGIFDKKIRAEERALRDQQDDINPLENEGPDCEADSGQEDTSSSSSMEEEDEENSEEEEDEEEDSDGDIDSDEEAEEEDDEYDTDEDSDGLRRTRSGRMLWRSDFSRSRNQRWKAELGVPCAPHTRVYTGHANTKTVKDVNFFGLQDEYVVSGSDCGNLFLWDRKTAELVNIIEGDGEVVNVIQGHPYEPTLAVSGIDHTIKIFSPDLHLQRNARKGVAVQSSDPNTFSSLSRRRRTQVPKASTETGAADEKSSDDESNDEVAPGGLSSRKRMHQAYQITSKNDMDRKSGRDDSYISQALFAQLARHMARQGADGEGGEEGGGPVVITEENCSVM